MWCLEHEVRICASKHGKPEFIDTAATVETGWGWRNIPGKIYRNDYQTTRICSLVSDRSAKWRNTGEALQVIQQLFENQVKINILNMGTIDDTPVGRLIFTVFSAFAQFERDMIVIRTQEGKSYARRHNPKYREGRPKVYSDEKIQQAYQLYQKGLTYRELSMRTGISISTLRRRFALLKSVEAMDHEKLKENGRP